MLEKARLARKPFFPIGRTGGEAGNQCAVVRPEEVWFCTPGQFEALSDFNLTVHELISRVFQALANYWRPPPPKVFIVHGHDSALKYELKDYIQNTLKLGAPLILQDEASGGRTIIEKFEDYAADCNVVFVLLTPDDYVASAADADEEAMARPIPKIENRRARLGPQGMRAGLRREEVIESMVRSGLREMLKGVRRAPASWRAPARSCPARMARIISCRSR